MAETTTGGSKGRQFTFRPLWIDLYWKWAGSSGKQKVNATYSSRIAVPRLIGENAWKLRDRSNS
jgi:hypothetical protein